MLDARCGRLMRNLKARGRKSKLATETNIEEGGRVCIEGEEARGSADSYVNAFLGNSRPSSAYCRPDLLFS
jgi:hypothetical protein